jgi:preprotein translocase SecE subunit
MKRLNIKALTVEINRITWPTMREVAVTSLAVFVIMGVASMALFIIDQLLGYLSHFVIS